MPVDSPLQIEWERRGKVCVLRLMGRFVSGVDSEQVVAKLDEIKRSACDRVLLDLRAMTSIGSLGIGFLVGLYTSVTKNPGGRFLLAGANARVQEVLALTRLNRVIPQAKDFDSGMAELA